MTPFRRLLRAAAVFVGANLTFLAVAAHLAPGWRAGQTLPSVDPQPPRTHDETQPGATHRENVTVMRRDGSSAEAWIITPRDTPGTVPGVVLVHGAGSADRDAMLEEATTLAAAGVAAITYAKRDENYSFISRDYDQLADDAVDAAAALTDHRLVDPDRVGMLGFSEGGWITPLAAERAPQTFDFLILGSPTVATPLQEVAWIVDDRIAGAPEWLRRIPAAALASGRSFINYLDTDPTEALAALHIPIYAVWGADDSVSPVATSVHALTDAASSPVTSVILADAGHDLGDRGWITDAAGWAAGLPATAVDQRIGVEPVSLHGAPRPHDSSWILNPLIHAGAALLLAVGSVFLPPLKRDAERSKRAAR